MSWAKIVDCGDAPLTFLDNTIALKQLDKAHKVGLLDLGFERSCQVEEACFLLKFDTRLSRHESPIRQMFLLFQESLPLGVTILPLFRR